MIEETLLKKIVNNFPEFENYYDPTEGINYNFAILGKAISSKLISKEIDNELENLFNLINKLCSEEDYDVINAIEVNIFESILDEDQHSIDLAKKYLNDKATEYLNETIDAWNI